MSKELTVKQDLFLDALFGEAMGDPVKAKKIAGYSDTTALAHILEALQPQIVQRARHYLSINLPHACMGLVGVLMDPNQQGAKERMAAAQAIMDRTGLIKQEGVKVEGGDAAIRLALPDKEQYAEE